MTPDQIATLQALGGLPAGYNVPVVVESDGRMERSFDLFSRLMRDRIVYVGTQVDAVSMRIAIGQLLFLEADAPGKPIKLYINSPGGSVIDGLALYDTMQLITSPVHTTVVGMAASMGSFLLSGGAAGHRMALPNSFIMIHELSGGHQGKFKDMKRAMQFTELLNERLCRLLAENTGQPLDKLIEDMKLDNWMTAEEALEYGLIDGIVECDRASKTAKVAEADAKAAEERDDDEDE